MTSSTPATTLTRLVAPADAPALADLARRARESMAAVEPDRDEGYYTDAGQAEVVRRALATHAAGRLLPLVIVDDGDLVGRVTLNQIVRGPLQSATVGYFVDPARAGRGLATRATAEIVAIAFAELGLHRLEAGTVPENLASQRVLARNGFVRYGYAPQLLHVGGAWRDHVLFQRLATDPAPAPPAPAPATPAAARPRPTSHRARPGASTR